MSSQTKGADRDGLRHDTNPAAERPASNPSAKLRVLDLCAGLGGWSAGFLERGHDVKTLETQPRFKPTICADVRTWDPLQLGEWRPNVILASPPCTRFSQVNAERQAVPTMPEDLDIFSSCLKVIRFLKPRFWALENVLGAVKYFRPWLGEPRYSRRPHFIWGNFPSPLIQDEYFGKLYIKNDETGKWHANGGRGASAIRSKIPLPISLGFCRAMEAAIEEPAQLEPVLPEVTEAVA